MAGVLRNIASSGGTSKDASDASAPSNPDAPASKGSTALNGIMKAAAASMFEQNGLVGQLSGKTGSMLGGNDNASAKATLTTLDKVASNILTVNDSVVRVEKQTIAINDNLNLMVNYQRQMLQKMDNMKTQSSGSGIGGLLSSVAGGAGAAGLMGMIRAALPTVLRLAGPVGLAAGATIGIGKMTGSFGEDRIAASKRMSETGQTSNLKDIKDQSWGEWGSSVMGKPSLKNTDAEPTNKQTPLPEQQKAPTIAAVSATAHQTKTEDHISYKANEIRFKADKFIFEGEVVFGGQSGGSPSGRSGGQSSGQSSSGGQSSGTSDNQTQSGSSSGNNNNNETSLASPPPSATQSNMAPRPMPSGSASPSGNPSGPSGAGMPSTAFGPKSSGAGLKPGTEGIKDDKMNWKASKESYDFWRSKGLTHNQALGMVAQERTESSHATKDGMVYHDPNARGDKGTAHGLYQWHKDRRDNILKGTGIDVSNASAADQRKAAHWEMTQGKETKAWDALTKSKSVGDAVKAGILYERPADRDPRHRTGVANDVEKGISSVGMEDRAAEVRSHAQGAPGVRMTANGSMVSPGLHEYERRRGEAGEFNAARSGEFGPGGNQTELSKVKLDSGKSLTVNAHVADRFKGFVNNLEGGGYKIDSLGGFNNRANVNNPSQLSMHGYGTAIDINPGRNPNNGRVTDMPHNIEELANKHGLSWGARFGDPMHFEAMSKRAWASKLNQLVQKGVITKEQAQQTLKDGKFSDAVMNPKSDDGNTKITPLESQKEQQSQAKEAGSQTDVSKRNLMGFRDKVVGGDITTPKKTTERLPKFLQPGVMAQNGFEQNKSGYGSANRVPDVLGKTTESHEIPSPAKEWTKPQPQLTTELKPEEKAGQDGPTLWSKLGSIFSPSPAAATTIPMPRLDSSYAQPNIMSSKVPDILGATTNQQRDARDTKLYENTMRVAALPKVTSRSFADGVTLAPNEVKNAAAGWGADAKTPWQGANMDAVMAPPVVTKGAEIADDSSKAAIASDTKRDVVNSFGSDGSNSGSSKNKEKSEDDINEHKPEETAPPRTLLKQMFQDHPIHGT